MRVERSGDATLYLGDCREVLRSHVGSFEVLITDPVWPNCPAGLLPGSESPWGLWADFWDLLESGSMPTKRAVVVMRHDSDPRFLQAIKLPYLRACWLPYVMPGYIGRML